MAFVDLAVDPWTVVPTGALVMVPLGSTEQHGPHLPFTTDTVIAEHVARAAASAIARATSGPVVVTPAQSFGASGEHQGFPGTASIGHEALRAVLIELVRSLSTWAERILFVNGHGGNVGTVVSVVEQLRVEGHRVSWVACAVETAVDAHAGHDETAVMLHIAPELVRFELARPGALEPLDELLPRLVAHGVRPVSPTGVLGDPTTASAAGGERLFAELVTRVVTASSHA